MPELVTIQRTFSAKAISEEKAVRKLLREMGENGYEPWDVQVEEVSKPMTEDQRWKASATGEKQVPLVSDDD